MVAVNNKQESTIDTKWLLNNTSNYRYKRFSNYHDQFYIKSLDSKLLTSKAVNQNYIGVVTKATQNFVNRMDKTADDSAFHGAALVMNEDTKNLSSDSVAVAKNHVLSLLEEIRDNKDIDSPQAVNLFVNEIKARNAADVFIGGRAAGYALGVLDYVADFLEEIGKGDISRGIEELQSGKVSSEKLESRASSLAQNKTPDKQSIKDLEVEIGKLGLAEMSSKRAKYEFEKAMNGYNAMSPEMQNVMKNVDEETVKRVINQDTPEKDGTAYITYARDDNGNYARQTFISEEAAVENSKQKEDNDKKKSQEAGITGDLAGAEKVADEGGLTLDTHNKKTGSVVLNPFNPIKPTG